MLFEAFDYEPFMVNESLVGSLILEENSFEVWVTPTGDGWGSGTMWDPFVADTASRFDRLMNSFAPYTTIHLLGGLFTTLGYAQGVSGGWKPKRGQRIVGAGFDITFLKLLPGSSTGKIYFAIGADDTDLLDDVEICDLTVDANLGAASSAVARAASKCMGRTSGFGALR